MSAGRHNFALAVDLGGSSAKLGLVDLAAGRVTVSRTLPAVAQQGLEPRLPEIEAAFTQMLRDGGLSWTDCLGVGVSLAALIDSAQQRVMSTNDKYPDAAKLDLRAWANQRMGLPIYLENDANCALAGEWQFGAARGRRSAVLMILGTGIGTSAVIDGRPLRGQHGQAGCLGGHLVVNPFGRPCTCGGIGCLETEASSWMLPELAREMPGFVDSALARAERIDFATLFRLAGEGDAVSLRLRDRCIGWWAAGVVSLIHAYDPEVVVMAGGVMRSGEAILPRVQQFVDRHAWVGWGRLPVVAGELGDAAALLGAAHLLRRNVT